jgi:hypothetical protein
MLLLPYILAEKPMHQMHIWLKGILAAAISGAAGGVLTGLAAVGIDPQHFNLQSGIGATMRIGAAAALINAVIGVAAYLQKSPLPTE